MMLPPTATPPGGGVVFGKVRGLGVEDRAGGLGVGQHRAVRRAQAQREGLAAVLDRVVDDRHLDGLFRLAHSEGQRARGRLVVLARQRRAVRRLVRHRHRLQRRPVQRHLEAHHRVVALVARRVGHPQLGQPLHAGDRAGGLGAGQGRAARPAQAQREGLAAFLDRVVDDRHLDKLLRLARSEGQRARGRLVVLARQRRAVRRLVRHRHRLRHRPVQRHLEAHRRVLALAALRVGHPHLGRVLRHRERVGAGQHGAGGAHRHVVRAALLRRPLQAAVPALAAVLLPGARDAPAVRAVDPPDQRVAQRAPFGRLALEVEGVGPARHQLDREPVDVAAPVHGAGHRVPHQHPARRGRVRGQVLALRLGDARRPRLLDVGDVDGDGDVAVQAAVARPHRELVARRPRLVVLARAPVGQRARRPVDPEQAPPRCRPRCCRRAARPSGSVADTVPSATGSVLPSAFSARSKA